MGNKFLLAKIFLKKAFTYLFILLFFFYKNESQTNLVPNYSFESMILPCFYGMPIPYTNNWYAPGNNSPDYYNVCTNLIAYPAFSSIPHCAYGYQFPKTGDAFAGIGTYAGLPGSGGDSIHPISEYVSVKLISPLKANTCYYGEFYTSLADICEYATNRISMLLTTTALTTTATSFTNSLQPQIEWDTTKFFTDTLNWVKVSGTFTAIGGEQYLTIGNFKDGNHTKLKVVTSGFTNPQLIGGNTFAYHFIDDVVLFECSDTIPIIPEIPLIIPNVFTPNNDGVNDVFKIELKNAFLINFSIYDRWGLLIKSDDLKNHTTILWDGRTTAGEACTAGVYFYTLLYTDVNNDIQKMNGYITLIK
jgi:gliding motility-associated-like protein